MTESFGVLCSNCWLHLTTANIEFPLEACEKVFNLESVLHISYFKTQNVTSHFTYKRMRENKYNTVQVKRPLSLLTTNECSTIHVENYVYNGNYPHNGTRMMAPLVIGATSQLLLTINM